MTELRSTAQVTSGAFGTNRVVTITTGNLGLNTPTQGQGVVV